MVRLVVLGIFVGLFAHCGPDSIEVLVHVQNLTPGINTLHVTAILDGRPAMQGKDFTQQLNQFTVKLPISAINSGQLVINVSGLAKDRCKLSAGRSDTQVSPGTPNTELTLALVSLPAEVCTLIADITPTLGPLAGGISLQLDGQNYAEGATVSIAGVMATSVAIMSPTRLTAFLPAAPAGAFGRVAVQVNTPDGQSVSRSDLFAYYASQLDFSMATSGVGTMPHSVAVGDFNLDQKPDLAIANEGSNNVSVFLGNGTGGFQLNVTRSFPVGNAPTFVAVGDFNKDQKPDLAVANFGGDTVAVLMGDGLGGFSPANNFPVSSKPASVALGDFNGDQKLDMVAAGSGGSNITVLLGNGTGGFGTPNNFSAGMNPNSVAVGDFDGDHILDLAVANYGGSNVSVLIGNGTGGFGTATNFSAGTNPYSVAVGDFNGDQKLDLVVANGTSGNVSVLLGNGLGVFAAPTNFAVGGMPTSVAVADLNGDQKSDLAISNQTSNSATVLVGNGTGGFGSPKSFPASSVSYSVAVGDFNGDQKPDMVFDNFGGGTIVLLTNQSK